MGASLARNSQEEGHHQLGERTESLRPEQTWVRIFDIRLTGLH